MRVRLFLIEEPASREMGHSYSYMVKWKVKAQSRSWEGYSRRGVWTYRGKSLAGRDSDGRDNEGVRGPAIAGVWGNSAVLLLLSFSFFRSTSFVKRGAGMDAGVHV